MFTVPGGRPCLRQRRASLWLLTGSRPGSLAGRRGLLAGLALYLGESVAR